MKENKATWMLKCQPNPKNQGFLIQQVCSAYTDVRPAYYDTLQYAQRTPCPHGILQISSNYNNDLKALLAYIS